MYSKQALKTQVESTAPKGLRKPNWDPSLGLRRKGRGWKPAFLTIPRWWSRTDFQSSISQVTVTWGACENVHSDSRVCLRECFCVSRRFSGAVEAASLGNCTSDNSNRGLHWMITGWQHATLLLVGHWLPVLHYIIPVLWPLQAHHLLQRHHGKRLCPPDFHYDCKLWQYINPYSGQLVTLTRVWFPHESWWNEAKNTLWLSNDWQNWLGLKPFSLSPLLEFLNISSIITRTMCVCVRMPRDQERAPDPVA